MGKSIISELPDGTDIQTTDARIAFEQNGTTYHGPVRPNPDGLLPIRNQAQLEDELGTDLEIADNQRVTISLDAALTLDKPIKFGLNSALEMFQSTNKAFLTYVGPGALFQNINPSDLTDTLNLHNIQISGNTINSVFDIVGSTVNVARDVVFASFDSLGVINNPFILWNSVSLVNLTKGLVITNPSDVSINISNALQFFGTGLTAFTILANNITNVDFNIIRATGFGADDSLLFFDPNSPLGSIYTVQRSSVSAGNFYQPGTDITINSVANNGSGNPRFTTAISHGLVVGKAVVNSGFADAAYNGTFIVTAVDTPLTGTTFDVVAVFTATGIGNMNTSSLDQTNVPVLATANINSPDSRFIGESGLEIFGSEVTSSVLAQNAFEVITSASWSFANLERFSEGVVNTGQLICDDTAVREYGVSYSATLEKVGGSSLDIGIIILKNGVNIAFNPPHTVNSGKIQINGTDLIELTSTDTLDIAIINYNSTSTAIEISQASLVVKK